ncbi:hypothetical protein NQ317_017482 [Molorchus minor]|uniref:Multidrug resistance-associated protein lethal(2)03659 n=1 Tax=Molorchus minor TaxID=1323400 RepID=A0ABQ9JM80_9CUCU|nr:hypothetical protein NQ317_017482 [Molorchus minor]
MEHFKEHLRAGLDSARRFQNSKKSYLLLHFLSWDNNYYKKRENEHSQNGGYSYTGSLFRKAYKKDLEEEDLYAVVESCKSKKCGDKAERQWTMQFKDDKTPSIYRLMWNRFGCRYLFLGVVNMTWKILNSIMEPYAISSLIACFKSEKRNMHDIYFYAVMVMLLNIFHFVYIHNYILSIQQLAIEIKTAFSSLIYRKALKLTPSAMSKISLGNIVTLITKDVYAFQMSIWMVNDTWIGIVQTCTICYLLYSKIGPVSFIGIGVLFSIIPVQIYIGKHISRLRLIVGKKTDQRLQTTQETLSTIRIIKMYTWERFFNDKVTAARIEEINKMLIAFYLKVFLVVVGVLCSRIGFYVLVIAYTWTGHIANTELIFLYSCHLRYTLGVVIPFGMGRAAELYSSIVRINKVIQAEELPPKKGTDEPTLKPLIELKEAMVHINEHVILRNVTFRTDSGLTLVTGTVGSGKSSLLKTMLQDYPLTSGYNEVVRVCALQYDFSLFDKGDETIVSDRGLNMSKGQQARVNLARAIYKDSEIYLLDDSLTALDAHVQDYIFNECIKNYLKDKICILVTQTASHIQEADNVVIMDKAEIKSVGKPNEKIIHEVEELVCKDDNLEKEVIDDEDEEKEEEKGEETKLLEAEQITKKKVYSEVKKQGEVEFATYKKYLVFGGGICLMLFNLVLFGVTQGTESYSDQVDLRQISMDLSSNFTVNNTFNATQEQSNMVLEAQTREKFTFNLYSIMVLVSTAVGLIKTYTLFDFLQESIY